MMKHEVVPPDVQNGCETVAPFVCEGVPPGIADGGVPCDLLLANLPYLTEDSIRTRPEEVQMEPRVATVGCSGQDGLGEIIKLLKECPSGLRVALEHDTHHGPFMRDALADAVTQRDQGGNERVTIGVTH